jgi:hypothetical protein
MRNGCQLPNGGSAPATPGFNAVAPEWPSNGAADTAPAVPAAESTLGSHPCVALSSAQVLPEWINRNRADNTFASNGNNPLNFVSRSRGSLQGLMLENARTVLGFSKTDLNWSHKEAFRWKILPTTSRKRSGWPPAGLDGNCQSFPYCSQIPYSLVGAHQDRPLLESTVAPLRW